MEDFFKFKTVDINALCDYGFTKSDKVYTLKTPILDGQFVLKVNIDEKGKVSTELKDVFTDEPYSLHLVEGASGEFVGKIRSEYSNVLKDISEKCYFKEVFSDKYSRELIAYIKNKFGDELEFLWDKYPNGAIWRRKDNRKWYCLIVKISKNKLGLNSDKPVDAIDVRSDIVSELINNTGYYKAYHMNKKNWITVCLDGSVDITQIFQLIDKSYELANKKH